MSTHKNHSLLRYWSTRYFIVVVIGMGLVAAATLLYIQKTNADRQYRGLERMVREIASEVSIHGMGSLEDPELGEYLIRLSDEAGLVHNRPMLFLLDQVGGVVREYSLALPEESELVLERLPEILNEAPGVFIVDVLPEQEPFLAAIHPIGESESAGYAVYSLPRENLMRGLIEFRWMRVWAVVTLIAVGWAVIYLMTRGLAKPIGMIVKAARQIVAGDYRIRVEQRQYHIKEIDELTNAIEEMADRLARLEAMRSQLLAGVTHELRTPITSISGLLQALKDGVVEGEEAKLFLDNGIKQTQRLHKMVEDLLDFNRFAMNSVAVRKESFNLSRLLEEIIHNWRFSQEAADRGVEIFMKVGGGNGNWQALSDPQRIEQVVVNLLNNAKDAMLSGGEIRLTLAAGESDFHITVQDNGSGIPDEEQPDIFVPFFRGNDKKRRVHGLGLGLPFSRLIARSLGGDLVLADSGPGGTAFTLTIPR